MNNTNSSSNLQQLQSDMIYSTKTYINVPIPKKNQKRSNSGAPLSASSQEGE